MVAEECVYVLIQLIQKLRQHFLFILLFELLVSTRKIFEDLC